MNLKRAIPCFVISYAIVTILCYASTGIVEAALQLPSSEELGIGIFEAPGFVMTVPYHIIINALTWSFFGFLYLRKTGRAERSVLNAIRLGAFWLAIALTIDVFAFVLIQHPYSMTAREFYIDYQPWITLTYLTVIGGPTIAYWCLKHTEHKFGRSQ